jgi:hypothetical protein
MLARAAFPAFFFTRKQSALASSLTHSWRFHSPTSGHAFRPHHQVHLSTSNSCQVRRKPLYYSDDPSLTAIAGSRVSAAVHANLGVFGVCYSGVSASALGLTVSSAGACTKARLGYELDPSIFNLAGDDAGLQGSLVKGVLRALVLNPIGAGFAFISLLLTFFAWCCSSRLMEIVSFNRRIADHRLDSSPSSLALSSLGLCSSWTSLSSWSHGHESRVPATAFSLARSAMQFGWDLLQRLVSLICSRLALTEPRLRSPWQRSLAAVARLAGTVATAKASSRRSERSHSSSADCEEPPPRS